MKYSPNIYKYISEDISNAFRYGFKEWEYEANKSHVKITEDKKFEIIEFDDYFEVNGYLIAKENFWEPCSPNVQKNPVNIDKGAPQAWMYTIDDDSVSGDGKYRWFELFKYTFPRINISKTTAINQNIYPANFWVYNSIWAIIEGEYRWVRIPENWELLNLINSIPWNCIEKAKSLQIPFIGFRSTDNSGKIHFLWECAFLLSSDHFANAGERNLRLFRWGNKAIGDWIDCGRWASVRYFLK